VRSKVLELPRDVACQSAKLCVLQSVLCAAKFGDALEGCGHVDAVELVASPLHQRHDPNDITGCNDVSVNPNVDVRSIKAGLAVLLPPSLDPSTPTVEATRGGTASPAAAGKQAGLFIRAAARFGKAWSLSGTPPASVAILTSSGRRTGVAHERLAPFSDATGNRADGEAIEGLGGRHPTVLNCKRL